MLMGFILGLLLGMIGTLTGLGFLAYWLFIRSNNLAAARFVNGIAQALASINKVRAPEPLAPRKEEPAAGPATPPRVPKARQRWARNDENGDSERP
jgi:hypothetical protein